MLKAWRLTPRFRLAPGLDGYDLLVVIPALTPGGLLR
jgi:hypothetical protein